MSNKQARATRRLILKRIVVEFEDGTNAELDITKVNIIDIRTKKSLFKEALEYTGNG